MTEYIRYIFTEAAAMSAEITETIVILLIALIIVCAKVIFVLALAGWLYRLVAS